MVELSSARGSIRLRPETFIGDVRDGSGLHHMLWGLLANSLDEHIAGHCRRIDVVLEDGGAASVEDDGRGIPLFDAEGRPFAEAALTQEHPIPILDDRASQEHVGRYGVGLVVVNALSAWLSVDVHRDGLHRRLRYENGHPAGALEVVGPSARTGTRMSFSPDGSVFEATWFDTDKIRTHLREISWMMPALTLTFLDRRTHVFHEPQGVRASLQKTRHSWVTPIAEMLVVDEMIGRIRVEGAVEWVRGHACEIESFANIERTRDGGTHVEGLLAGLREGLLRADPSWTEVDPKETTRILRDGLRAVVGVRLCHPTYGLPAKSRLVTPEVKDAVTRVVSGGFEALLARQPALLGYLAAHRDRSV